MYPYNLQTNQPNYSASMPCYNAGFPQTQLPAVPVRTSFMYFNDVHGCADKMGSLKTASDVFAKTHNSPMIDSFKVAAGDVVKGNNRKSNSMWVEFLNNIKLDFTAMGNHELDQGIKDFSQRTKGANFKYVSSNIEINPLGELSGNVKNGKLVKSWIENRNGHLYGFVGLSPTDAKYKKPGDKLNNINIKSQDVKTSLTELQKEVNKLQHLGVNKIVLLSHFDDDDNKIAKNISGIDIIVSGHKHRIHKGIVAGKNLFTTPSGEPLIKVEGGRDNKYVGTLDVAFDQNGVITSAANKLQETSRIPEDISVLALKNKFKNIEYPVGILRNTLSPAEFSENVLASFVADSVRKKSGADIVLFACKSINENLNKGIITSNTLEKNLPYKDKLHKITLTEKELIDTLKTGAKLIKGNAAGAKYFQTAGLKFTITKDSNIKDVYFETPEKKLIPINSENPDSKKTFSVVYDDFLLKSKDVLTSFKKPSEEEFNWDKKDATIEEVKNKHFVPFSLVPQNHIKLEA